MAELRQQGVLLEPLLGQEAQRPVYKDDEPFAALQGRKKSRKARALIAEIDGAVQLEPVRARRDREARGAGLPVSPALGLHAPSLRQEGAGSLGKPSGRKRQHGAPLLAPSTALKSELAEARHRASLECLVAPDHAAPI